MRGCGKRPRKNPGAYIVNPLAGLCLLLCSFGRRAPKADVNSEPSLAAVRPNAFTDYQLAKATIATSDGFRTCRGAMQNAPVFLALTTRLALGIALALGGVSVQAHAASFDCGTARTAVEHTICTNGRLSEEDEDMAKAYEAARAQLSQAGRESLRRSQRAFLSYVTVLCDDRYLLDERDNTTNGCLEGALADRIYHLKRAVTRLDGRVFYQLFDFKAHVIKRTRPDDKPFVAAIEVISLQIDDPHSEADVEWNQAAKKRLFHSKNKDLNSIVTAYQTYGDDGILLSMDIDAASPELVVASVSELVLPRHGATRQLSEKVWSWSPKLHRSLSAGDVFDSRAPWRAALKDWTNAQVRTGPSMAWFKAKDHDVDDPERWRIQPDGIHMQYTCAEVTGGQNNCVAPEPVFTWKDMSALLRKDLPFAPGSLQIVSSIH